MRYLPHTPEEIREMLAVIGRPDLDELFTSIPAGCRCDGAIGVPAAMTEWQLGDLMGDIAATMTVGPDHCMLVGAGRYHHYIPEIVRSLAGRSEFLTSYTPYQPEMAQGTLQGIFEYQTLTARLLGLDVANASLYDGASALAEGLLMGLRIVKRSRRVAVSTAVHPHYREVVKSYLRPTGYEIIDLPCGADGRTDLSLLQGVDGLAAVALQSPNFFGVVEDLKRVAEPVHDAGALLVAAFTEPLAYGLYRNPGQGGADIACGEGQSLGLPVSFGGAALGMFACRGEFVRSLPGRLVGETVDLEGRRGFVLTLSTREQHIRREKATSNICSNQGLCALTTAIYMASLGGSGLRQLARLNYDLSEYLKAGLVGAGAELVFSGPTFNEFVLRFGGDFAAVRRRLQERGIVAGIDLGGFYPQLAGCWLFCVTEKATKKDLDTVISEVRP
ncbi:MAG: aminomethyl-transferring glycine dehydrogenase subunit GcvPA [Desulfoprunum sp.]|uniref:aminomethyl-transferring glycine dehydrogenase subunit GcvPA n=1 Tax=Desulfoprunum sp. TaxID=2020866 RepID=UPI003C76BFE2